MVDRASGSRVFGLAGCVALGLGLAVVPGLGCGDDGGASSGSGASAGGSEATGATGATDATDASAGATEGTGATEPGSGTEGSASTGSTSTGSTEPTGPTSSTAGSGGTGETEGTAGTGSSGSTTGALLPCNGHVELCDRPLDQVALPSTHNSHSALDEGYSQVNANHQKGVAAQLEDGVRGLLLDIYLEDGETTLCHGACFLGSTPHAEVLEVLASFMEENPREVLAIIYQDDVEPALVEADFVAAGLDGMVWTWDGGPMPTLGEMIDANTRLVVTAESKGPPPAWYHHAWGVFWDTPYSFDSADDFSCELNRGSQDNPLFLVNHWVNSVIDLPSKDNAQEVNAFDVLYGRISGCRDETGQMPTMVAVDFYEEGDLFAAVDALNGF